MPGTGEHQKEDDAYPRYRQRKLQDAVFHGHTEGDEEQHNSKKQILRQSGQSPVASRMNTARFPAEYAQIAIAQRQEQAKQHIQVELTVRIEKRISRLRMMAAFGV